MRTFFNLCGVMLPIALAVMAGCADDSPSKSPNPKPTTRQTADDTSGGDNNSGNPIIGTVSTYPNPAVAGQKVALVVDVTDADLQQVVIEQGGTSAPMAQQNGSNQFQSVFTIPQGATNSYDVQIAATDAAGHTTRKAHTLTVTTQPTQQQVTSGQTTTNSNGAQTAQQVLQGFGTIIQGAANGEKPQATQVFDTILGPISQQQGQDGTATAIFGTFRTIIESAEKLQQQEEDQPNQ